MLKADGVRGGKGGEFVGELAEGLGWWCVSSGLIWVCSIGIER